MLLDPNTCCDDSQGQFAWGGLGDLIDEELLAYGYYGDAMSMLYSGGYEAAMDVVIHELGHNHGREHAPCGDPGGPDPAFPHPNASLGTRGWDSGRDELIIPALDPLTGEPWADFMSYCWPNWWSDYSWRALTDRVERMSGLQGQAPPPWDGLELRAYVHDDGTAQWRLLPAPFRSTPAAAGSDRLRLLAADGSIVATMPVVTTRPGDGATRIVRANVSFDRLELQLSDLDLAAPGSAVKLSSATR
jgi:hypothetical protein